MEEDQEYFIRKNARGNKVYFQYAEVTGQCCWKMCTRRRQCDNFGPGEYGEPDFGYIYTIKAYDC